MVTGLRVGLFTSVYLRLVVLCYLTLRDCFFDDSSIVVVFTLVVMFGV